MPAPAWWARAPWWAPDALEHGPEPGFRGILRRLIGAHVSLGISTRSTQRADLPFMLASPGGRRIRTARSISVDNKLFPTTF